MQISQLVILVGNLPGQNEVKFGDPLVEVLDCENNIELAMQYLASPHSVDLVVCDSRRVVGLVRRFQPATKVIMFVAPGGNTPGEIEAATDMGAKLYPLLEISRYPGHLAGVIGFHLAH